MAVAPILVNLLELTGLSCFSRRVEVSEASVAWEPSEHLAACSHAEAVCLLADACVHVSSVTWDVSLL